MKNLTIVYTCNDAMFNALYISILTIVRRTKASINFYCLSGNLVELNPKYIGLTNVHANELNHLVKKYNKNSSFRVIDCSKQYINIVNENNKKLDISFWTPYTLFRLLIDKFDFNSDVILYLDIDVLVSGDIAEVFKVDMKDNELCVCHDINHRIKHHHKWFCAGVMLMNLTEIKKTKLLETSLKYCLEKKPKWWDQDALNMCWKRIMFWEDEYRFHNQPNAFWKCRMAGEPIIWHFYNNRKNIRPWTIDKFLKQLKRRKINYWDKDYKIIIDYLNRIK